VRPEGLGKLEKIHLDGTPSRDLPVCSIVPQPLRYRVPYRYQDDIKMDLKQNEDENYIQMTQDIAVGLLIQIYIMILPIVADFFVVFFSLYGNSKQGMD
jgi:hypothetical protein